MDTEQLMYYSALIFFIRFAIQNQGIAATNATENTRPITDIKYVSTTHKVVTKTRKLS